MLGMRCRTPSAEAGCEPSIVGGIEENFRPRISEPSPLRREGDLEADEDSGAKSSEFEDSAARSGRQPRGLDSRNETGLRVEESKGLSRGQEEDRISLMPNGLAHLRTGLGRSPPLWRPGERETGFGPLLRKMHPQNQGSSESSRGHPQGPLHDPVQRSSKGCLGKESEERSCPNAEPSAPVGLQCTFLPDRPSETRLHRSSPPAPIEELVSRNLELDEEDLREFVHRKGPGAKHPPSRRENQEDGKGNRTRRMREKIAEWREGSAG
jgi:hypothetical protein